VTRWSESDGKEKENATGGIERTLWMKENVYYGSYKVSRNASRERERERERGRERAMKEERVRKELF